MWVSRETETQEKSGGNGSLNHPRECCGGKKKNQNPPLSSYDTFFFVRIES